MDLCDVLIIAVAKSVHHNTITWNWATHMLYQSTFVLKSVAFAQVIQLMVKVLVNFPARAILE